MIEFFTIKEEDIIDIITMHLLKTVKYSKLLLNLIHFYYVAILALPKVLNP